jgi:hypothetical protein
MRRLFAALGFKCVIVKHLIQKHQTLTGFNVNFWCIRHAPVSAPNTVYVQIIGANPINCIAILTLWVPANKFYIIRR